MMNDRGLQPEFCIFPSTFSNTTACRRGNSPRRTQPKDLIDLKEKLWSIYYDATSMDATQHSFLAKSPLSRSSSHDDGCISQEKLSLCLQGGVGRRKGSNGLHPARRRAAAANRIQKIEMFDKKIVVYNQDIASSSLLDKKPRKKENETPFDEKKAMLLCKQSRLIRMDSLKKCRDVTSSCTDDKQDHQGDKDMDKDKVIIQKSRLHRSVSLGSNKKATSQIELNLIGRNGGPNQRMQQDSKSTSTKTLERSFEKFVISKPKHQDQGTCETGMTSERRNFNDREYSRKEEGQSEQEGKMGSKRQLQPSVQKPTEPVVGLKCDEQLGLDIDQSRLQQLRLSAHNRSHRRTTRLTRSHSVKRLQRCKSNLSADELIKTCTRSLSVYFPVCQQDQGNDDCNDITITSTYSSTANITNTIENSNSNSSSSSKHSKRQSIFSSSRSNASIFNSKYSRGFRTNIFSGFKSNPLLKSNNFVFTSNDEDESETDLISIGSITISDLDLDLSEKSDRSFNQSQIFCVGRSNSFDKSSRSSSLSVDQTTNDSVLSFASASLGFDEVLLPTTDETIAESSITTERPRIPLNLSPTGKREKERAAAAAANDLKLLPRKVRNKGAKIAKPHRSLSLRQLWCGDEEARDAGTSNEKNISSFRSDKDRDKYSPLKQREREERAKQMLRSLSLRHLRCDTDIEGVTQVDRDLINSFHSLRKQDNDKDRLLSVSQRKRARNQEAKLKRLECIKDKHVVTATVSKVMQQNLPNSNIVTGLGKLSRSKSLRQIANNENSLISFAYGLDEFLPSSREEKDVVQEIALANDENKGKTKSISKVPKKTRKTGIAKTSPRRSLSLRQIRCSDVENEHQVINSIGAVAPLRSSTRDLENPSRSGIKDRNHGHGDKDRYQSSKEQESKVLKRVKCIKDKHGGSTDNNTGVSFGADNNLLDCNPAATSTLSRRNAFAKKQRSNSLKQLMMNTSSRPLSQIPDSEEEGLSNYLPLSSSLAKTKVDAKSQLSKSWQSTRGFLPSEVDFATTGSVLMTTTDGALITDCEIPRNINIEAANPANELSNIASVDPKEYSIADSVAVCPKPQDLNTATFMKTTRAYKENAEKQRPTIQQVRSLHRRASIGSSCVISAKLLDYSSVKAPNIKRKCKSANPQNENNECTVIKKQVHGLPRLRRARSGDVTPMLLAHSRSLEITNPISTRHDNYGKLLYDNATCKEKQRFTKLSGILSDRHLGNLTCDQLQSLSPQLPPPLPSRIVITKISQTPGQQLGHNQRRSSS